MTVQAGCPLYSTADVLMATAHEPEIPGLAAATYLAGTADELQALLTKAVNQEGNIHAARIRDALDRLGQ